MLRSNFRRPAFDALPDRLLREGRLHAQPIYCERARTWLNTTVSAVVHSLRGTREMDTHTKSHIRRETMLYAISQKCRKSELVKGGSNIVCRANPSFELRKTCADVKNILLTEVNSSRLYSARYCQWVTISRRQNMYDVQYSCHQLCNYSLSNKPLQISWVIASIKRNSTTAPVSLYLLTWWEFLQHVLKLAPASLLLKWSAKYSFNNLRCPIPMRKCSRL